MSNCIECTVIVLANFQHEDLWLEALLFRHLEETEEYVTVQ